MEPGKVKKMYNLVWHYYLLALGDRSGQPGGKKGVVIGDEIEATVQDVVDGDFLVLG